MFMWKDVITKNGQPGYQEFCFAAFSHVDLHVQVAMCVESSDEA